MPDLQATFSRFVAALPRPSAAPHWTSANAAAAAPAPSKPTAASFPQAEDGARLCQTVQSWADACVRRPDPVGLRLQACRTEAAPLRRSAYLATARQVGAGGAAAAMGLAVLYRGTQAALQWGWPDAPPTYGAGLVALAAGAGALGGAQLVRVLLPSPWEAQTAAFRPDALNVDRMLATRAVQAEVAALRQYHPVARDNVVVGASQGAATGAAKLASAKSALLQAAGRCDDRRLQLNALRISFAALAERRRALARTALAGVPTVRAVPGRGSLQLTAAGLAAGLALGASQVLALGPSVCVMGAALVVVRRHVAGAVDYLRQVERTQGWVLCGLALLTFAATGLLQPLFSPLGLALVQAVLLVGFCGVVVPRLVEVDGGADGAAFAQLQTRLAQRHVEAAEAAERQANALTADLADENELLRQLEPMRLLLRMAEEALAEAEAEAATAGAASAKAA